MCDISKEKIMEELDDMVEGKEIYIEDQRYDLDGVLNYDRIEPLIANKDKMQSLSDKMQKYKKTLIHNFLAEETKQFCLLEMVFSYTKRGNTKEEKAFTIVPASMGGRELEGAINEELKWFKEVINSVREEGEPLYDVTSVSHKKHSLDDIRQR